jgi:hypothetical protein
MNRFATAIAIPFLAVVGLLFACLRLLLRALMRIAGWDLAWPPVEIAETEKSSSKFPERTSAGQNPKNSSIS